jgi:hypothetical protein
MSFEVTAPVASRGVHWRMLLGTAALFTAHGFATDWHLRFVPSIILLFVAVYALLGAARTAKKPGKKTHRVSADAAGLSVDGKRVMDRGAIETAYCVPIDNGLFAVHVEGRFMRHGCVIHVSSADEGNALLAALHVDASAAAAHFRALPPWAKHMRWLAIVLTASPWFLVNTMRLIPAWGFAILGLLYTIILLPTLLPQRVDVGHDGVFLRWLGNKRFIPFSKIDIVSSNKLGVDLFLKGDRYVEIRLTQKDGGADAHVKALVARIQDGIAAQAGLTRADEEAFLARSGRDLATWMREMRALGAGEHGGYRAAAIPRERLWAVVESPAADPSAREGAALALSASLDAGDRTRIAALARMTAQPRLRIALDEVSREQEAEQLRLALEAAEAETELAEGASGSMPAARAALRRDVD